MSDILTPEQTNAIELLKCRSIGESFNEDDNEGREALLYLVRSLRQQLAVLAQEKETLKDCGRADGTGMCHGCVKCLRRQLVSMAKRRNAQDDEIELLNRQLADLALTKIQAALPPSVHASATTGGK